MYLIYKMPGLIINKIDEKDIELIMDQCEVSRIEAIKALEDHQYDIVNAIMDIIENHTTYSNVYEPPQGLLRLVSN